MLLAGPARCRVASFGWWRTVASIAIGWAGKCGAVPGGRSGFEMAVDVGARLHDGVRCLVEEARLIISGLGRMGGGVDVARHVDEVVHVPRVVSAAVVVAFFA